MPIGQWREGEPPGARGGDTGRKPVRHERTQPRAVDAGRGLRRMGKRTRMGGKARPCHQFYVQVRKRGRWGHGQDVPDSQGREWHTSLAQGMEGDFGCQRNS